MISTMTRSLTYRGGHVVLNPHVHDFRVSATVEAVIDADPSSPTYGMGADSLAIDTILREEVAAVLGGRMVVWKDEPTEYRTRPCDWTKGQFGPAMPELEWSVRPTVEYLAFYVADRIHKAMDPAWKLREVVLAETERAWATVTDFEEVRDFPGPIPVVTIS